MQPPASLQALHRLGQPQVPFPRPLPATTVTTGSFEAIVSPAEQPEWVDPAVTWATTATSPQPEVSYTWSLEKRNLSVLISIR